MASRRVHLFKQMGGFTKGCMSGRLCHYAEAHCGATVGEGETVCSFNPEDIEQATCKRCLATLRDSMLWRAEESTRRARAASQRIESLRIRDARKRKARERAMEAPDAE